MYSTESLTNFHTAYHNPGVNSNSLYMRMQMLPGKLWEALKAYPDLDEFLEAYAENQYDLQGNKINA